MSTMRNGSIVAAILAVLIVCPCLSSAQQLAGRNLLDAAKNGQLGTVQSLLEKGISPTALKDENGRTPLHLAAANGHQATAEAILQHGADINARDNTGNTPLDLAEAGGHSALSQFLLSKGGVRKKSVSGSAQPHMLKPSLEFKTVPEFEKEIGEPAVLLDSTYLCFFAPKRREREAKVIFGYLVKAYDALYQIVGTHTNYKIVVYAFPKGNPHGWGGTSECSIEYDDSNLDLPLQMEWTMHKVPHVSGYIEEMAHNFVHATKVQFGWEMIGWSLGAEVSQKIAGNPILIEQIRQTREGQRKTYSQYIQNGFVFPKDLPANQCDRIHAWILHQCASKYGPRFWTDFFREVRNQKQAFDDAVRAANGDQIRNARYQITIACLDRLPDIAFKKMLRDSGISLTTDVKSLHPEAPGWNRRLTE